MLLLGSSPLKVAVEQEAEQSLAEALPCFAGCFQYLMPWLCFCCHLFRAWLQIKLIFRPSAPVSFEASATHLELIAKSIPIPNQAQPLRHPRLSPLFCGFSREPSSAGLGARHRKELRGADWNFAAYLLACPRDEKERQH